MSLPPSSNDLSRYPYFVDFSDHVIASSAAGRSHSHSHADGDSDRVRSIAMQEASTLYDVYDIFSSSTSIVRGPYSGGTEEIRIGGGEESKGDKGAERRRTSTLLSLSSSSSSTLLSTMLVGRGANTYEGQGGAGVGREVFDELLEAEERGRDALTYKYIRRCLDLPLPPWAQEHPAGALARDFLADVEGKERTRWMEIEQRAFEKELVAPYKLVGLLCHGHVCGSAREQKMVAVVQRCLRRWTRRWRGRQELFAQQHLRYVVLPEQESRAYLISQSEEAIILHGLYCQCCAFTEGVRRRALEHLALVAAVSYAWVHTSLLQQAELKWLLFGSLAPTKKRNSTRDWTVVGAVGGGGGSSARTDGRQERKSIREVKVKDYTLFHLLILSERDGRRALWDIEMDQFLVLSTRISKSFYM